MTGYPPRYPQAKRFRAKPAYHGELHVDPSTGAISRITLEDKLNAESPVRVARISVQYGNIEIGGKNYVCPIHSVAAAEFYDPKVAATRERFVNVVHFSDYHKFGSTARIVDDRESRCRRFPWVPSGVRSSSASMLRIGSPTNRCEVRRKSALPPAHRKKRPSHQAVDGTG